MTDMTTDDTVDQSTVTARTTNLYTDDELHRVSDAIEAYNRITTEQRRHRDDWLKVIGPALVMVRTKVEEVTGITNVNNPNYLKAIGEELKRTGLDVIHKTTRSYLLRIMDNLPEIEAWLADRPNPDRLNHPKTIWKAWYDYESTEWEDDPGVDWEDDHEYWGDYQEPPESPEEVDCAHCGRKTTVFDIREDGRYFCPQCHDTNPEGDDSAGADKDSAKKDSSTKQASAGKDSAGADKDHDAGNDQAGGDGDDEARGDDDPIIPFSYETFCKLKKENAALRQRNTDLESKLTSAVAARATAQMEHASITLENQGLKKQVTALQEQLAAIAGAPESTTAAPDPAPPTVPGDDDLTPKVDRKLINKALKKVGNDARKVKPSDVIPRS